LPKSWTERRVFLRRGVERLQAADRLRQGGIKVGIGAAGASARDHVVPEAIERQLPPKVGIVAHRALPSASASGSPPSPSCRAIRLSARSCALRTASGERPSKRAISAPV